MAVDSPLNLLQDEFLEDDATAKKRASERLDLVAKLLGPEKARTELVPWMKQNLDQEDEVLYLWAQKCTPMLELVGGPAHQECLFPVLEKLVGVEETYVREAAVSCCRKLIKGLTEESNIKAAAELVLRLAKNEWFASKMSACALASALMNVKLSDEDKTKVKSAFYALCKDDTPMVRRAAGKHLGEFISGMGKEELVQEVVPLYSLCSDPQEAVAINWIANLGSICSIIAELKAPELFETHLWSYVKTFGSDRSWRVRYTIAQEIEKVKSASSEQLAKEGVLPLFVTLLRDLEGEVRNEAISHVPAFSTWSGLFVSEVIPVLCNIEERDSHRGSRQALAESVVSKTVIDNLGPELTKQHLVPLWEHLLKEGADVSAPDVRLIILGGLDNMVASLGGAFIARNWAETLQELFDISRQHNGGQNDDLINPNNVPSAPEDIEHPQWRLRVAILRSLPKLAGSGDSEMEKLVSKLWISCLGDEVYEVRVEAARILGEFAKEGHVVGPSKVLAEYVPTLDSFFKSAKSKYNQRVVFVHAFQALLNAKADLARPLFDSYEKCLDDKVANVRLVAAGAGIGVTDEAYLARFSGQLNALCNDADTDVSAQAKEAVGHALV